MASVNLPSAAREVNGTMNRASRINRQVFMIERVN
jgi:hypothetical protein